jgi:hypothetical protein
MRTSHFCRVCGQRFVSARSDAIVCSDTCRKRRQRGGDLAYLTDEPDTVMRRVDEECQAANLEAIRARREEGRATRSARSARRDLHRMALRAEIRREMKAEVLLEVLHEVNRPRHPAPKLLGPVAAALKLFQQERRNDLSARAIAEFLSWDEDVVERAMAVLRDEPL